MFITGTIIKGLGIGKKLGLPPTMNLRIRRIPNRPSRSNNASALYRLHRRSHAKKLMRPKGATLFLHHGIYAVFVKTSAGEFPGVLHFGPRPAVHAPISFEVHCFGLKRNLYGKRVRVEVVKRLRGVKDFATVGGLKKAIEKDIEKAERILNGK